MVNRPGNRNHISKYPEQSSPSLGRIGVDDDVLQALQGASARAFSLFAELPNYNQGIPTEIIKKDYKANIREAVRADPTEGAFTIFLPEIKDSMVGGVIFIVNITASTNTITIEAASSDRIDAGSSTTISFGYWYKRLWAAKPGQWVVI